MYLILHTTVHYQDGSLQTVDSFMYYLSLSTEHLTSRFSFGQDRFSLTEKKLPKKKSKQMNDECLKKR